MFHPYVSHTKNVLGDGNCGFRTVVVCLGYAENRWLCMRQLLDELDSNYDAYDRVFSYGIDDLRTSLSFFRTCFKNRTGRSNQFNREPPMFPVQ